MLDKEEEEIKLSGRELYGDSSQTHLFSLGIKHECPIPELLCSFMRMFATRERMESRDELTHITRLRHIVIRTELEPTHSIIHRRTRSEHEYRGSDPFSSEFTTDRLTIHTRESEIEEDDIMISLQGTSISFSSPSDESHLDIRE